MGNADKTMRWGGDCDLRSSGDDWSGTSGSSPRGDLDGHIGNGREASRPGVAAVSDELTFATSGANIWSDVRKISRLFWSGIDAIEIGSLRGPEDLESVLFATRGRGMRWAVHAPLWETGLKRDRFGHQGLSEDSRLQLEGDFAVAAESGADYVVLHFPSFSDRSLPAAEARRQTARSIEDLRRLAQHHRVEPVLELKLGHGRDPGVIGYFIAGELDLLAAGEFGVCLDVGDWILAARALGVDPIKTFEPLAPVTRVIHVHGIHLETDAYYWRLLHPADPDADLVAALCRSAVRASKRVRIVFEHRPHDFGLEQDLEGLRWLQSALRGY
jgi:sugar phosphate isomerase/epimerase